MDSFHGVPFLTCLRSAPTDPSETEPATARPLPTPDQSTHDVAPRRGRGDAVVAAVDEQGGRVRTRLAQFVANTALEPLRVAAAGAEGRRHPPGRSEYGASPRGRNGHLFRPERSPKTAGTVTSPGSERSRPWTEQSPPTGTVPAGMGPTSAGKVATPGRNGLPFRTEQFPVPGRTVLRPSRNGHHNRHERSSVPGPDTGRDTGDGHERTEARTFRRRVSRCLPNNAP